jgi:hypothetical protein
MSVRVDNGAIHLGPADRGIADARVVTGIVINNDEYLQLIGCPLFALELISFSIPL